MPDYFDRIAEEWAERAGELARWVDKNMVNRTDVWGRYLPEKYRGESHQGTPKNKAITAPFRQERGKIFLAASSLEKHFKAKDGGGVLGLHSASSDGTSRWFGIDIDLHDDDDLSVTREGNFVAAKNWWIKLVQLGLDPILFDSNGQGGFHLFVFFEKPMDSKSVLRFCDKVVEDFDRQGLDQPPDIFPGSFGPNHYGSWLRIPGRHHTRKHYSRIWNDEPYSETPWLEGHEAIDAFLGVRLTPQTLAQKLGIEPRLRTVCLDFDGVIHSYQSGWQGASNISDPPIHGVDKAIKQLRQDYRVVVHSARCGSEEGRLAIEQWLAKYRIEVDEVCDNKPPAFVYIDDRAIPFRGDWQDTIGQVHRFRK
ncbi:MAG: hypothetical protein AAGA30_16880 [Planctomycetota bacterium]